MRKFFALFLSLFLLFATSCARTETVKFNKQSTLVIAHRGLSGLAIENTDDAFILAGERSYYGIEADVRKTADGKFVIYHDDNFERFAGKSISVENSTYSELLAVTLSRKNKQSKIATLKSFINICKQYDKRAVLEFKTNLNAQDVLQVINEIQNLNYIENVTFISFYYETLLAVRQTLPNQPVQLLFSDITNELTQKLIANRIDVGIYHKSITKKAIETFHNAGLKVNCWTVNAKSTGERLARLGVDYITTDILE